MAELGWQMPRSCVSSKSNWCTIAPLTSTACAGGTFTPPPSRMVLVGRPPVSVTSPPIAATSSLDEPASMQASVSSTEALVAATVAAGRSSKVTRARWLAIRASVSSA